MKIGRGECWGSGMPIQDDEREQQMVALFNLTVPDDRNRSDIDAQLELDGVEPLDFELKSSSRNSVSTVRDFGPEHIAKWHDMHWLFAFYDKDGKKLRYCYYASPLDMAPWVAEKEEYVRLDFALAMEVPQLIGDNTLTALLGDDQVFGLAAAQNIMKKQWRKDEYVANADLPNGEYSRERMLALLQKRSKYLIRRGSTLNNPHIPESYLMGLGLERIVKDHASTLRRLARDYRDRIDPGHTGS